MVTPNQEIIIDKTRANRKVSDYDTKESHQITGEESKRSEKNDKDNRKSGDQMAISIYP